MVTQPFKAKCDAEPRGSVRLPLDHSESEVNKVACYRVQSGGGSK